MAKPTDLPVHATDANYPMDGAPEEGTPTKVEPLAGKQALGHRPAEKPPGQSENWWKNLVYQWCAYVSAGELEGPITIDGDLEVDGNLTVTGTTELQGEVTTGADLIVGGDAEADDYNHNTEFRATLPVRFDGSNTAMGMSADDPLATESTAGVFHYYTPPFSSVGIREGDVITKVLAYYTGNTPPTQMNLRVMHYRHDLATTTETAGSATTANGIITVVPDSGKNTITLRDVDPVGDPGTKFMLDVMYAIFEGAVAGVRLESIDVYWTHPA